MWLDVDAAEDRRDWYDCFERDYSLYPPEEETDEDEE
jgi:hypothetical protein